MTAKKDCCVGEPCMGDPGGMHSLDCPVYLASMEALEARRPKLAQGGFVFNLPGGESTAAALDRVEQELRLCKQRAADLEQDRNRAVSEKGDLAAVAAGQARLLLALEADLARALQERDALGVKHVQALDEARRLRVQLRCADARIRVVERESERREETVARNVQERDRALDACDALREQRDLARAELATARAELEQLRAARSWIVARDGGRYCERCEQEVRRGEAYELQDGTGGLLLHIHCPHPAAHTNERTPDA